MQLVLHSYGLTLKVNNGLFRISTQDAVRDISPEIVDSIAVTQSCLLSSDAVRLAAEAEIPIYFFNRIGDADACLRSPYFESIASLRRLQVYFSDDTAGADWVLRQFELKTEGQISNLRYLANRRRKRSADIDTVCTKLTDRLKQLEKHRPQKFPDPDWTARLLGWEGQSARLYWEELSACLPPEWQFDRRSRRPAQDAYNALTNYFYGMLYSITEQALFAAGLDPHLGILHADEYDRPTLAYDLIEPFRPWVDRFLLLQIFAEKIPPNLVAQRDGGYWVTHDAKKTLIPAFNAYLEKRNRWEGRRIDSRAQIFRHAAALAKLIRLTVKRPR